MLELLCENNATAYNKVIPCVCVCVCVCVWLISDGKVNAATLSPSQVALGKVIDINGHKFVKTGSDPAKGSQFTALTDFASVAKPPLQWQRGWGGSGDDTAIDFVETDDGGVIVAGRSDSTDISGLTNHGGTDIVLIKYDRNGELVWQRGWGGSGDDRVYDLVMTDDGGVIVVGDSDSTDIPGLTNYGGADAILVKFDGEGQPLWQQSWGGSGGDVARIAVTTADGGVIVAGESRLVKFDNVGELVWEQSGISAFDLVMTVDGGVVAVDDGRLAKFDSAGELIWEVERDADDFVDELTRLMLNSGAVKDLVLSATNDGGVIMTVSESLDYDVDTNAVKPYSNKIAKYDDDGQLVWWRSLPELGMVWNQLSTEDGGVIIASADTLILLAVEPTITLTSPVITKYDWDGQIVWQHEWIGHGANTELGNGIMFTGLRATEGGGIYAVGQFSSTEIEGLTNQGGFDIAVVKYGW